MREVKGLSMLLDSHAGCHSQSPGAARGKGVKSSPLNTQNGNVKEQRCVARGGRNERPFLYLEGQMNGRKEIKHKLTLRHKPQRFSTLFGLIFHMKLASCYFFFFLFLPNQYGIKGRAIKRLTFTVLYMGSICGSGG